MSNEPRRWPGAVYDHGEEPDARFTLANERTFLAWIRTTLALLVAAAALDVVDLPLPALVQQGAAAALALGGVATAVQAWRGWAKTERALREQQPLPNNPIMLPLVIVVVVVAAALLAAAIARLA
ncbi:MAG: DUF202 domain-containing protein [Mobilicoccus sp.]|nr:DUF202 domain-containing protein [Mobilicoccus sp.]